MKVLEEGTDINKALAESMISDLLEKAKIANSGNFNLSKCSDLCIKIEETYDLFEKNIISKERIGNILLEIRDSEANYDSLVSRQLDSLMKQLIEV
ncbi:MAG: hypothetical protein KAI71_05155 [Candidatus Pacebacteria bacterium]|nr:hypothetical protein [Candidatus Paceibacterota bacterium]